MPIVELHERRPQHRVAQTLAGARGSRRARSIVLLWRARSGGAHRPELREHLVLDQAREQLDGRALRADDVFADDPRDDLEVTEAPDADALVPLGQELGELVELLMLAPRAYTSSSDRPRSRRRARTRRRAAAKRGGSRGSRASRIPSRARARGAPPGTPTATSARDARGTVDVAAAQSQARRSRRFAAARSRRSTSRVASSASTHACFSQSSDDWCTVWKRSSSRCTHSSGALLQREQLVGAEIALVVRLPRPGEDRRELVGFGVATAGTLAQRSGRGHGGGSAAGHRVRRDRSRSSRSTISQAHAPRRPSARRAPPAARPPCGST